MKDLQPNILDDYEHRITRAIDQHSDEASFPTLEGAGIDRKSLESYLFDYQSILDSEGSQKAQLTKYGIIAVIPIIIISAFPESMLPWGKHSLIVGVAMGVLLAAVIKVIASLIVKMRIKKLRANNVKLAEYTDKVMNYQKAY